MDNKQTAGMTEEDKNRDQHHAEHESLAQRILELQEHQRHSKEQFMRLQAEYAHLQTELQEKDARIAVLEAENQALTRTADMGDACAHTLMQMSPDAVKLLDLDMHITFANQQAVAMYHYSSAEEMYGTNALEWIAPEDRQRAIQDASRIFETGVLQNIEYTLLRRDSSRFPAELNAALLRDEQQQPAAILVITHDISRRREREAAFQASELRFQTLVDTAPIGVFIREFPQPSDPDPSAPAHQEQTTPHSQHSRWLASYQYMNAAAEAMTGYTRQEWQTLDPWNIVHPDSRAQLVERLNARNRGEPVPDIFESKIITKQGDTRWLRTTTTHIELDGKEVFMDIAIDITDHKYAEQAREAAYHRLEELNLSLKRSRDLMRTIFDGMRDGLVLLDKSGDILAVNEVMAGLLGTSINKLISRSWADCCQMAGQHLERPTYHFPGDWALLTLRDGRPRQRRERIERPDGIIRTFDLQVWPVYDTSQSASAERKVYQVVLHAVDVTEKIRLEALMIENERLIMARELTQLVAHEVNTPLQSIMGTLDLMSEASEEERGQFVSRAQQQIGRIGAILHRLTESYHAAHTTPDAIDVHRVINDVLDLTKNKIAQQHIAVETTLEPNLPPVPGESEQLKQVILNLIFKALAAMPDGGHLHIKTRVDKMIPAREDTAFAELVVLEIADTGSGMDTDEQTQIFAPSLTTGETGASPGLFLSRRVIAQLGGAISVYSQPGVGTTFTISLPLK